MKVVVPPLDLPSERPVTYEENILNYSGNPQNEVTEQERWKIKQAMSKAAEESIGHKNCRTRNGSEHGVMIHNLQ